MKQLGVKRIAIPLLAFLALVGHARAQSTFDGKIQLLENPRTHEWCAYRNESEWMSDVDSLTARNLGRLLYSGGRLTEIFVTRQHETEDWSVEDRYFLGPKGALERLSRIIEIVPGDRVVKETFSIQGNKAIRQTREVHSLSTDRPAPLGNESLPNVPVSVNAREFPFAAFIAENRFSGISAEKVCLPSSR